MNRYQSIGPFTTASIPAGQKLQIDIDATLAGFALPASFNIVKAKIIPSAAGLYDARIYVGAAYLANQRLVRWEGETVSTFYPPDGTDGGVDEEGHEGWPLPYDEAAGLSVLHFEIENASDFAATYTYSFEIEEVPVFTATGAVAFRGAVTAPSFVGSGAGLTGVLPQGLAAVSSPTFAGLALTAPLTVPNGGLGVATLAANGVLYGNGVGVVLATAQGPANSVLTANAGAPAFSATPTLQKLTLTGGVIPTGTSVLDISATLPNTTATENGVLLSITGAGSVSGKKQGLAVTFGSGYTGSGVSRGINTVNSSQSTGTSAWTDSFGNFGVSASAIGQGTGHNVGASKFASGSSTMNAGNISRAVSSTGTPALNIGIGALALNATVNVAGFFGLMATAPSTLTQAALVADNGATGSPIFVGRNNGSIVFQVLGNGDIVATLPTSASGLPTGALWNSSGTVMIAA